jgi:Family of unknown function (DUF5367)
LFPQPQSSAVDIAIGDPASSLDMCGTWKLVEEEPAFTFDPGVFRRGRLHLSILANFRWTITFPLMAFLLRSLCNGPGGAVAILAPTLLLDPFSSAFFPVVFPNMAPEVAGVFGGWMLWCCAGGLLGTTIRRSTAA